MAKKQIWIDSTRPPTNYIWAKTDGAGNVIGVYQYNGSSWVLLPMGRSASVTDGDGYINGVTLNGDSIQIAYSIDPLPNTIIVRTENGTIKAVTPSGEDSSEVATVEMFSWNEVE